MKSLFKKKNYYSSIIVILLLAISASMLFGVSAGNSASYSWYCVHRKDHKQPEVGTDIAFVERYNGYYLDRNHGDDCEDKVVYLTFDAGYENGNIEKTLDVMKEEDVKGAFFILGNLVTQNTELVKRMFEEGHLVCNHTYSHKSIVGKGKNEIKPELEKIENVCLDKTGYNMSKYFRPPEGRFDEKSLSYINELGYKTIFWSFAYADWDNNKQMSKDAAKEKILTNIHNGEIMLLHPTSSTNAQILGDVIRELKAQGFRFGTLNELSNEKTG